MNINETPPCTGRRREPALCPSSRCSEGSILIGAVRPDGNIGILPHGLEVDSGFVDAVARSGGAPEQRFRFAAPCRQNGCINWENSCCQVIELALTMPIQSVAPIQCAIRDECTWYAQRGLAACRICPAIATDI